MRMTVFSFCSVARLTLLGSVALRRQLALGLPFRQVVLLIP
jgi:hypothetical protein